MTTASNRLLAKRWDRQDDAPESAFLPGHLRAVHAAAKAILDTSAAHQLAALDLDPATWQNRLMRIVLFAAATHDLGKANDHFQNMIFKQSKQAVRHEWLTYILLTHGVWQNWSRRAFESNQDWRIALWCVTGHHPGHGRSSPPRALPSGTGAEITLFLEHPDFADAIAWITTTFKLGAAPQEANRTYSLTSTVPEVCKLIQQEFKEDMRCWSSLSDEMKRLAAVSKACLVATDVAGSALPKRTTSEEHSAAWLRSVLAIRPEPTDLETLVQDSLNKAVLRPFQVRTASSKSRVTLVRAGCGTGKTLAAYLWAARRCPGRRVYFCYPTTGTATEGFRGYLFDECEKSSKLGAKLFHSRADVDVEMILGTSADLNDDGADDVAFRVESLATWSTPVASCTVDTVLGLFQNHRRGLFAWPVFAQSAFVFDEIHAYDTNLFGTLLRFIETMRGVPILLMTASISEGQQKAVDACLNCTGESLGATIEGPAELEALKRYQCLKPEDPLAAANREVRNKGQILWVCNTVARAMIAAEAAKRVGLVPLVYHSRFRYEDRVARHRSLIAAFASKMPTLAICTQVAEMSLDLSATMLITDLAPVSSLIQRLGRLNRHTKVNDPWPFIVVEPIGKDGRRQSLPYDDDNLDLAKEWLRRLANAPLSQTDLTRTWGDLQRTPRPHAIPCTWLDGGPSTQIGELREASPGLNVIMERDASVAAADLLQFKRRLLPMGRPPQSLDWRRWRRLRGIPVAPDGLITYDAERGAQWSSN